MSVLNALKDVVISEGFRVGTEDFERRLLQLRVEKCKELRAISGCSDCPIFDECIYIKKLLLTQMQESTRAQKKKDIVVPVP
jgi:hypothetical protein